LLDEPSLGLDIAAQSDFLDYLKDVARTATIAMVTHHLEEIIPPIKDVLLMKDGRVFRFGPKADILTPENLSALFDTPIAINQSAVGVYSMHRV
jgi:iron complex transport system ATP-binding protein